MLTCAVGAGSQRSPPANQLVKDVRHEVAAAALRRPKTLSVSDPERLMFKGTDDSEEVYSYQ